MIFKIILTVIFGSLDFAKAIWSNDQDMLKKASQKFIKRLQIMIIPVTTTNQNILVIDMK